MHKLITKRGHRWKGMKAGYKAKHNWIIRNYGQPSKCEKCGKDNLTGHSIQWANISGEYLREITDYRRLCVSCHKLLDLDSTCRRGHKIEGDNEITQKNGKRVCKKCFYEYQKLYYARNYKKSKLN